LVSPAVKILVIDRMEVGSGMPNNAQNSMPNNSQSDIVLAPGADDFVAKPFEIDELLER